MFGICVTHAPALSTLSLTLLAYFVKLNTDGPFMASLNTAALTRRKPTSACTAVEGLVFDVYDLVEYCALLGYYAANSSNSLPLFRDNLSSPTSRSRNQEESGLSSWFLDP